MAPPVIFIIFRRPEKTRRVFEVIREAQPRKLLVVADGPHAGNAEEAKQCEQARAVVEDVDWDCEVYRNYADENMGCGLRPATGITWAFEHVDRAIILEDDCVPDPSFFPFCKELLEYYADTPQVMHINGNTYGLDQRDWNEYSYGFCNYPQAWGWATWRDAWQSFNFEIPEWPEFRESGLLKSLDGGTGYVNSRKRVWDKVYGGNENIWDYQWWFAVEKKGGLSVVPEVNLVSNIGFGERATNTKRDVRNQKAVTEKKMSPHINHNSFLVPDVRINKVYRENLLEPSTKKKIEFKIIKYAKKLKIIRD
jgi:hypothetical protein